MLKELQTRITDRFKQECIAAEIAHAELTIEITPKALVSVCQALRDEFGFEQLIDLCGVDYLTYGEGEWETESASGEGFSRGVQPVTSGRFSYSDVSEMPVEHEQPRYAVVYHLLSLEHNQRLRLRVRCADDDFPAVVSLVDVWASANWFEREAFDLYGIVFEGHPDLRRILTDYGFIGHPFRKDFPQIGQVEMRYDPEQKRVLYEPVSVEPRVLVPKVIREAQQEIKEAPSDEVVIVPGGREDA